jgi:beta-phosphoglucomutase-like phosphatase (HAD superfamily)
MSTIGMNAGTSSDATTLTAAPLRLVIFDCDGVLVDSEHLSSIVVARSCTALGHRITSEEALHRFMGKSLDVIRREMETAGVVVPPGWEASVQAALVQAMAAEAVLVEGAEAALDAAAALNLPVRVASNSSFDEMEAKFGRTGLRERLAGRIHSGRSPDIRPKPAPDVFLQAAAAEGIPPENCLVVEDSDTGMAAAHAAGMACVLLRADGAALSAIPGHRLHRIAHLDALPALLRQSMSPENHGPGDRP